MPIADPDNEDDALTRAYVMNAIERYERDGLEATIEYYRSEASAEDGRTLVLLNAEESVVLVYRAISALQGQYVGPGSRFSGLGRLIANATEEGFWATSRGINPITKQEEPRRFLAVLHDGLMFGASHSALTEDVADSTKEYVNKAIAKYETDGLEATIAHYNSQDSLDGQFYLFLIGADDIYLAHPIFPHLIGTDIKDVVGSDGQELGKEIAQATEDGIWVEYLWPHPVSRKEQQKVTWSVRHDGLIFSSGYYAGAPEAGPPAWQDADPREYTIRYVDQAIERYEREGLESMLNYYNSVASFEGQWYLFATDANDIYHVHPLIPHLIGTDIKDVVGSDGYELGKALAAAENGGEGVWVEYLWPHPVTLKEVPKVGYAVRHDGMLFASGYYPQVEDPAAQTKAYVQQAIEHYQANGLDATIAHYNSPESVEGQWNLTLADENDIVRVAFIAQSIIGTDLKDVGAGRTRQIGREMTEATEEGLWVSNVFPNVRSSETLYAHTWAIRHDGLLFSSRYYDDRSDVPDSAKTDDALTRAYVMSAIERYERDGREAALAYYNTEESAEGERVMFIFDPETRTPLAHLVVPLMVGSSFSASSSFGKDMTLWTEAVTEGDGWREYHSVNPVTSQNEPKRSFGVLHDGLVFISGHFILKENIADVTKNYVNKAIQHYENEGLEATIAHYDSRDSMDGVFYLFLMDENDIYLAHPIFPNLVGTDIKDVVGSDGQELGKEIAQATEQGIWVEYLWLNPVSGKEESKTTWAIRHDGLIFASGYYAPLPDEERPPWLDANPRDYTMGYVNRAIQRYEEDGLEAMLAYYNSVAAYEGEWYLFATDANDIYHVHPLLPHLIGTDIKDVVGVDGYELGKEIAKATEEGRWVEYLWQHPATGHIARKISYAVRRDGMIFASGYYPAPDDLPGFTQAFVREAIDLYESDGMDAVIELYGSGENSDGLWFLQVIDSNSIYLVNGIAPGLVGFDLNGLPLMTLEGSSFASEVLKAPEEGRWINLRWQLASGPENLIAHAWVVRYDGLFFASAYFDTLLSVPTAAPDDDALTRAYVQKAIDFYEANGLDATAAQYKSAAGVEDGRPLTIIDAEESVLLVYSALPSLVGQYVGPGSRFSGLGQLIDIATEEGHWFTIRGINPVTKQEEPRRVLVVLHDGLVFAASHSALTEDVADSTQEYVNKAIAKYNEEGLEATIAHYNSQDSLDGQFYLFLIGEDDIYLAHPIFPHLIGTDIKDVVGSDGQELGKEIAQATEDGIWVEYLWPHPTSRKEQQKVTWSVRHDGLIFSSGYYAGAPEAGPPAWQDADPREYTVQYVEQAIERYERDGLQSMLDYYNSVASFEGQWYLFATDANDIYHVHPLISRLIGTDIKDVVGSDGYELGKELAKAADGGEGVWVEYLWPHPVTLKEVPKVGYAVRHDGMLFASGYYPQVEDPAAQTKAYVQQAIEHYQANGLDATVAYYNSPESADGQWSLTLADENDIVRVAFIAQSIIGTDLKDVGAGRVRQIGREMAAATEEGLWVSYVFPNVRSSETLYAHTWAIRHDGLLFSSRYYDDRPDVPN